MRRRHILVTGEQLRTPSSSTAGTAESASGVDRVWLDVPYADKDEAKQLEARWDAKARRWFAPSANAEVLARWAAKPPVPDLLPGEDRSLGSGSAWERLRRMILDRAGHRCEVCKAGANPLAKVWLEAHERWTFDPAQRVQRLGRLICLCTPCHTVTHYGLAGLHGREREAFAHLVAVTGMTEAQARKHIDGQTSR